MYTFSWFIFSWLILLSKKGVKKNSIAFQNLIVLHFEEQSNGKEFWTVTPSILNVPCKVGKHYDFVLNSNNLHLKNVPRKVGKHYDLVYAEDEGGGGRSDLLSDLLEVIQVISINKEKSDLQQITLHESLIYESIRW